MINAVESQPTPGRRVAVTILADLLAFRQAAIALVAVGLFVFFSLSTPYFFTFDNVVEILRSVAFITIVGVGITYLFIAGEIDLSVGSVYGFASIFLGWLLVSHDLNIWLSAVLTLAACTVVGAMNGIVTTVIGVPSFIVTLGAFSLWRGIALVMSGAFPITYPDSLHSSFFTIANGEIGGMPASIFWMVGITIGGAVILKYTRFGYHIYASGGNPRASRAAGINTVWVKIRCFMIVSFLCGFVALLAGGWIRTADPSTGNGFELQVIGAAIIGGVALTGGDGSVFGTFIGALILGIMANGLVLAGVQGNYNQVLIGIIIVAVAMLELLARRIPN